MCRATPWRRRHAAGASAGHCVGLARMACLCRPVGVCSPRCRCSAGRGRLPRKRSSSRGCAPERTARQDSARMSCSTRCPTRPRCASPHALSTARTSTGSSSSMGRRGRPMDSRASTRSTFRAGWSGDATASPSKSRATASRPSTSTGEPSFLPRRAGGRRRGSGRDRSILVRHPPASQEGGSPAVLTRAFHHGGVRPGCRVLRLVDQSPRRTGGISLVPGGGGRR